MRIPSYEEIQQWFKELGEEFQKLFQEFLQGLINPAYAAKKFVDFFGHENAERLLDSIEKFKLWFDHWFEIFRCEVRHLIQERKKSSH